MATAINFEHDKKYKRGGHTFFFLFLKHGWKFTLAGLLVLYASYEVYYGRLNGITADFLAGHPTWYITVPIVTLWFVFLGFSILILAVLQAFIEYEHYKFILDEHSFHLHRGLFFTKETSIPYRQISNVHIARPYHYHFLGIAKLDIVTAADKSLSHDENKSKEYLIPVIDTKIARALAKQLIASSKGIDLHEDGVIVTPEASQEKVTGNTTKDISVTPKNIATEEIVEDEITAPKQNVQKPVVSARSYDPMDIEHELEEFDFEEDKN